VAQGPRETQWHRRLDQRPAGDF